MAHATYDDVNLILRLYDMRREEKMRAARTWFVANFRPKTMAGFNHLCPPGSEENARTVDVQINRLRQKIEEDPSNPVYLQTVRGSGYTLHLD